MPWYEIGALLLLIICAIPILILVFVTLRACWLLVCSLFEKEEPQTFESSLGTFTRTSRKAAWQCDVETVEESILAVVNDSNGQPDPVFLQRLPAIIADLPSLERIAREKVPELSREHHLSEIMDSDDAATYDFALGFIRSQEVWAETHYVEFKGRNVVGSWSFD